MDRERRNATRTTVDLLQHVPEQKRLLLHHLVDALSGVAGVAAIGLGGSYASGAYHASSDLDIALYYAEDNPFAIPAIQRIADSVATAGPATVTGFYEWGAWVNGGAWIHTPQGKVDFLYRNLDHVQRSRASCSTTMTDSRPTASTA